MPPHYIRYYSLLLLILAFNGRVNHAILVALVCLPISFGILASPAFRRRFRNFIQAKREKAKAYHHHGGTIPWKSAFFLAFLPTLFFCMVNGRAPSPAQIDVTKPIASGTLLLSAPVFALSWVCQAELQNPETVRRISKWNAALIAASIMLLFYLIALRLGSESAALGATILLYSGSAVLSTIGQGLWSHDGVALGVMVCLFLIVVLKHVSPPIVGFFIGLTCCFMLSCRLSSAALVIPIAIWLLIYRRKMAYVALGTCAALLLPLVWLHPPTAPAGLSLSEFPVGLYGLLFSPGAGLFIYQPWAWFLFAWFILRKRLYARDSLGWLFLGMCLSLLLVSAAREGWTGPVGWGSRYIAELIPIMGLLLVPIFSRYWNRLSFRKLALALGFASLLVQGTGVYGRGMRWLYNPKPGGPTVLKERVLDWTDPPFLYPLSRKL